MAYNYYSRARWSNRTYRAKQRKRGKKQTALRLDILNSHGSERRIHFFLFYRIHICCTFWMANIIRKQLELKNKMKIMNGIVSVRLAMKWVLILIECECVDLWIVAGFWMAPDRTPLHPPNTCTRKRWQLTIFVWMNPIHNRSDCSFSYSHRFVWSILSAA